MHDEHSPLHDLTPEQIVERGRSIITEGEYWKQVLADCGAIADALGRVTESLANGTVAAVSLLPFAGEHGSSFIADAVEANAQAMPQVMRCMETLRGLIQLADGRGKMLDGVIAELGLAAGIALDDDGEGGGEHAH
jgi:hypothetical protein